MMSTFLYMYVSDDFINIFRVEQFLSMHYTFLYSVYNLYAPIHIETIYTMYY